MVRLSLSLHPARFVLLVGVRYAFAFVPKQHPAAEKTCEFSFTKGGLEGRPPLLGRANVGDRVQHKGEGT